MKILIYARVSTTDQDVDQQAEYCKKWAINNNHQIIWTIKDKESGRKELMERKQFSKIIQNTYNFEYDAVLVYHMDRLTRNWNDVTVIEKYFKENWDNKKLLTATYPIDLGTAQGRFMFRLMMAQQCYMPEDMLEKQRIGIERAKKQGKYKGGKKGRKWAINI
jgi:DNA invertase Pin-like site-specific DNA recombinase